VRRRPLGAEAYVVGRDVVGRRRADWRCVILCRAGTCDIGIAACRAEFEAFLPTLA